MAKELSGFYTPGTTGIYAILYKAAQVYNGSGYEDFLTANWGTYDIPLTEDSTTGFFAANMPAGQPAGDYEFILYLEASPGTPAPTDARISGVGSFSWGGTAIVNERAIYDRIGEPTGDDIATDLADMMGATFNRTTDSLEALRNRGDVAWTTITASAIRSAVGLANANLDTQLSTIDGVADSIYGIVSSSGVVVAASSKTGYTISGTLTTLDALNTSLSSTHGAGSWATATGFSTLTTGDIPTTAQIADAVWDEALSGHATAGSAGAALSASGGGSDPLLNTVPGSYASGTAGHALGRIGSARVTATSPVATGGDVTVTYGDDYYAADGRALDWTGTSANIWPDLTDATITVYVDDGNLTITGSVVTPTGTQKVRCQPTATQTATLTPGVYDFDVKAALASSAHVVTLIRGKWTVTDSESV